VSIGEDGPSQMALEDMAALRAVHGSAVLHPSDANQVAPLVAQMADRPGISYMRTLRGKTTVHTPPGERVRIGGSRIVRSSDRAEFTVVACGVTVTEAVKAHAQLQQEGAHVQVLDCYSVKPIDEGALRSAAKETKAIVTVEDHWPEGGLGEAVVSALADDPNRPPVVRLAVRDMPASGTPDELLHAAGIDAAAIVEAVRAQIGSR
jgi:transketolase